MSCVKYTEIVDLKIGVENLSEKFSRLTWNGHYETIYRMNRFYSYEEFEEIAESYKKANNICDDYLEGKIGIEFWSTN